MVSYWANQSTSAWSSRKILGSRVERLFLFFLPIVSEEIAAIGIRRIYVRFILMKKKRRGDKFEGEYNCHLFLDTSMFQFEADRFVAASLVSQQDQYLMSGPGNHMSSSGREAFSPAVQWREVYLQLQSGVDVGRDNNEWKSWTSTALPVFRETQTRFHFLLPRSPYCQVFRKSQVYKVSCKLERFVSETPE